MKRFMIVLVMLVALLTACTPATNKYLETGVKAIEPCLWLIAAQAPAEDTQACLQDAAVRAGTIALEDLTGYLSTIPAILVDALFDALDGSGPPRIFTLQTIDRTEPTAKLLLVEIEKAKLPDQSFLYPLLGLAYAQGSVTDTRKDVADIKDLLTPETIALLLLPLTMLITYLAKVYIPHVQGVVTIMVNALANGVTVGITMYLGGEATLGYIALFTAIGFVRDQAAYWFVINPEKARAKELVKAV
jgi:hypothetical protein